MLTHFPKLAQVFLIIFLFSCERKPAVNPQWPEVSSQTKPWTRWWWHGSAVTREGITSELEAYQKAGIGGVEITPIYGVSGSENEFISYLSPEWVEMLVYTLNEAERLGLGVDMATGTGWPFGGPWVDNDDACKNMIYKTCRLSGGESLRESVQHVQEPMVRAVGNHIYEMHGIYKVEGQETKGSIKEPLLKKNASEIKIDDLVEPIASNKNLQMLALDQVRFKKQLPLHSLMAYSESGETINLTTKVDQQGKLNWTAPQGNWTLYALFQGWHGKMVERAAPGGEGNVIDHFDKVALKNYLSKFDSALSGYNFSSLRAFFNDSYEVDDARGSADFTPLLFEEFKARKGYDLLEHLPALFAKDSKENNERVLCDYREIISELILENFTRQWKEWAHEKGALVRNQAHGSPANILDLYEVVDIPEMEGEDFLRIKMASSSANVSGKSLTSSESATWLGEHFKSNLADIKKSLDRFMLSGVNHVFYHGTTYSPSSEPWPGRLFYAAVHLNPRNSLWNDFAKLNNYVTRCQSFLQQSKADNDVLLYFPIYDRYSTPGNELIEHFDGVDRQFEGTAFKEGAEFMLENGYAFDYISDKQLVKTRSENGLLMTSGSAYKTIVIPQCNYIPLATLDKLVNLAAEGATIVIYKGLPAQVAGYGNLKEKQDKFDSLISKINSALQNDTGVSAAKIGKGQILIGNNLGELLGKTVARRESMSDEGLRFSRNKRPQGTVYFIANWGDKNYDGWVSLNSPAGSAFLFNPMNGQSGKAQTTKGEDEKIKIYLQLDPMESIIIETYEGKVNGSLYPIYSPAGKTSTLTGEWKVRFLSGGPELPEEIVDNELQPWTNYEGEKVKIFSGTASYTLNFSKPESDAEFWRLDLGEVDESAEIILNGNVIDTLLGPSYNTIIPGDLFHEENELTIKISNLMANRIAHLDKNNVHWKKFYNVNFPARLAENRKRGIFDASGWDPSTSGLSGPVTLTPVEYMKTE